jgi:hypothetical protein
VLRAASGVSSPERARQGALPPSMRPQKLPRTTGAVAAGEPALPWSPTAAGATRRWPPSCCSGRRSRRASRRAISCRAGSCCRRSAYGADTREAPRRPRALQPAARGMFGAGPDREAGALVESPPAGYPVARRTSRRPARKRARRLRGPAPPPPTRHCQLGAIRNEFRQLWQLSCAAAAQSARLRVHSGAFTKDNCVGERVRGSS